MDEAPAPLGKPKFNPDEFFFFWTFSAAASTIVSGGVAERVSFLISWRVTESVLYFSKEIYVMMSFLTFLGICTHEFV